MSNDIIDSFIKNQAPKVIEQMKTMSDQEVINKFWAQSNNPMIPQQLKDYFNTNKERINTAIINIRKQL